MAENVKIPPLPQAPTTVVGGTPTSTFPFDFPFFDAADIIVLVDGIALEPSAFTVTGYAIQDGQPVIGGYGSGQVVLDVAVSSCTVTIDRFVADDRETQFSRSAPLGMPALNGDLNRLTARTQDIYRYLQAAIAEAGDSLAMIGKVSLTALAAGSGGALVGVQDAGSGSVAQTLAGYLSKLPVRPEDFGAVGDGTTNDRAAVVAAFARAIATGRDLSFGSGKTYNLGNLTNNTAIFAASAANLTIFGNGATLKVNTAAVTISNVFIFTQPKRVFVDSLIINDTGYDAVDFVNLKGAVAFRASATSVADSGNVTLKDCQIDGGIALLIVDGVDQTKRLKNVKLVGANKANNAYYGINCQGQGDDVSGSLTCIDVRRAYIGYGNDGVDLDLNITRTAAMVSGSSGVISIASNTAPGSVQTDTRNTIVRATCSGLMAGYGAVATFQLLSNTGAASIKSCRVDLNLRGATTQATNSVSFRSFNLSGDEVTGGAAATGVWDDITLSGDLSLAPISIPATQASKGRLWLVDGAKEAVPAASARIGANFNLGCKGTYTPVWTAASANPVLNNGTLTGEYALADGVCHVSLFFQPGSTTGFGSGFWSFSLPFSAQMDAFGTTHMFDSGTANVTGVSFVLSGQSTLSLITQNSGNYVGPLIPFTWQNGDYFRTSIAYLV